METSAFFCGFFAGGIVGAVAAYALFWDRANEARAAVEDNRTLRRLLGELQRCEAGYRNQHDYKGSGHRETGRAWDLMRRAGDAARVHLGTRGRA